jgi:polyhydroxybutyrate depolymerase
MLLITRFSIQLCLVAWLVMSHAGVAGAQCRVEPSAAGSFTIDVGATPVAVRALAGWTGGEPLPLVLLLHGSGGTGARILQNAGLSATADRHGFLVAYPDGGISGAGGFVWNIPGVPTVDGKVPGPGERDDVAFLTRLVDRLIAAKCADPARIYATGLSGGGRMASWLACVAPDRFAAVAPVVGLRAGHPLRSDRSRPNPATCRPSRPITIIAFAGDADGTNPVQGGGAGYWQYGMHAAEQRWAQLNGCIGQPTTRWVTPRVYEERYGDCRQGTEVIARVTTGAGHEWTADNEALWQLLSAHRRGER